VPLQALMLIMEIQVVLITSAESNGARNLTTGGRSSECTHNTTLYYINDTKTKYGFYKFKIRTVTY
jgi:hypothetical protein